MNLASVPTKRLAHYSANPDEPVFFYGGIFSNFDSPWALNITMDQPWDGTYNALYRTVEHFFQACKAAHPFDHEHIRRAISPGQAKRRGNSRVSFVSDHEPLLREDWESCKYEVMLVGLRSKFANPHYRQLLLDTGNRLIAEDSPSDFIWGIRDEHGGFTGQNLLGKALMDVRDELRA